MATCGTYRSVCGTRICGTANQTGLKMNRVTRWRKRMGRFGARKTYQSYPFVPGRHTYSSAIPVIIMWRNDTTQHDNNIQHCLHNTDHSATSTCVCVSVCVDEVWMSVLQIWMPAGRYSGIARSDGPPQYGVSS